MLNINELPKEIQDEIKITLQCFNICHVIFMNGRYNVSQNISISSNYSKDHKYIGSINNTDVYTKDQLKYFRSLL